MLLSKIRAYLVLSRPLICISAFLMAVIGYWLSIHQFDFSNINTFLGAIAVTSAMAFANVLNDIFDAKGDKLNYPDRPIPLGTATISETAWLTGFFLAVSLVSGFLVGWRMFLFTIFLLVNSIIYDVWINKIPFLGKVVVAMLCALTLATGYFVTEGGDFPVIPLLAALFFVLARDLIETISDDAGDRVAGRLSLYALWGKKRVLQMGLSLVIMSVILLLIPLFTVNLTSRLLYLLTIMVLLILPVAIAGVAIWKDQSPANIRTVAYWAGIVFFSSFVVFLWLV
jgi:4-hydroxybenzoate polyprenyltransferase